jgi:flagellar biosynthesis protein FlhB
LAENQDGQEKSEEPSSKRLDEARQKGNVPKSQEVNSTAILLVVLVIMLIFGSSMKEQLSFIMRHVFSNIHNINIDIDYLSEQIPKVALLILSIIGPITIALLITGVAVNIAQVGLMFTTKPIEPDFKKLNPISGLKRIMFSRKSMVDLAKNIGKLSIVSIVSYLTIMDHQEEFILLIYKSTSEFFDFMFEIILILSIKILIIFIIISVLDFIFQKKDHIRNLKMTKQEVKDESKQMEGDPQVKGRIKSMQRQLTMNRMMSEVPHADVVITNPTHYAIALKYDKDNGMRAPKVIAKGMNKIALKIRAIAEENKVTIVENPLLTRAMYKVVDIGDEVPEEFYETIAEILAYVYSIKNKKL